MADAICGVMYVICKEKRGNLLVSSIVNMREVERVMISKLYQYVRHGGGAVIGIK